MEGSRNLWEFRVTPRFSWGCSLGLFWLPEQLGIQTGAQSNTSIPRQGGAMGTPNGEQEEYSRNIRTLEDTFLVHLKFSVLGFRVKSLYLGSPEPLF